MQHSDGMSYCFKSAGNPLVLLLSADAAVMVAKLAKHCQSCHKTDKLLAYHKRPSNEFYNLCLANQPFCIWVTSNSIFLVCHLVHFFHCQELKIDYWSKWKVCTNVDEDELPRTTQQEIQIFYLLLVVMAHVYSRITLLRC